MYKCGVALCTSMAVALCTSVGMALYKYGRDTMYKCRHGTVQVWAWHCVQV